MTRLIVSDELWETVEPLVPKMESRRALSRARRQGLEGILFVLKAWSFLAESCPRTWVRLGNDLLASLRSRRGTHTYGDPRAPIFTLRARMATPSRSSRDGDNGADRRECFGARLRGAPPDPRSEPRRRPPLTAHASQSTRGSSWSPGVASARTRTRTLSATCAPNSMVRSPMRMSPTT